MQEGEEQQESTNIWMENAGFLYDRLLVQKLKWPSLTFQWLPYRNQTPTQTTYHCLYATHSSGTAQAQHIYIAEVSFPTLRNMNQNPIEMPASKLKNIYRFTHQSQVNRARYCPNDCSVIAARTDEGPVCIFRQGNEFPAHLLDGSLNGGFALEWSRAGILSGDFNGNAYFWRDMESGLQSLNYGTNIEDIKLVQNDIAAIVGDSGYLSFWDLRTNSIVQTSDISGSEKRQVYTVSVNPVQNMLLLTGGEDHSVKIWDRRNLNAQLHKFQGHDDSVMSIEWSPINSSIFASGSADKKVKIWDLMRVGFQIPKDLGGTDELLFTHEGHKGGVNDLSWNPYQMLLGSTQQQQNTLQFYQMTNNLHQLQYAEDIQFLKKQCFS